MINFSSIFMGLIFDDKSDVKLIIHERPLPQPTTQTYRMHLVLTTGMLCCTTCTLDWQRVGMATLLVEVREGGL